LVHNPGEEDSILPYLIGQLGVDNESMPTAMGVLRAVIKPTYDELLHEQEAESIAKRGTGDIKKLIYSGELWTVGVHSDVAN
jgi:2-oxoglutarate ferredoxin oxidoreductase subunit beta